MVLYCPVDCRFSPCGTSLRPYWWLLFFTTCDRILLLTSLCDGRLGFYILISAVWSGAPLTWYRKLPQSNVLSARETTERKSAKPTSSSYHFPQPLWRFPVTDFSLPPFFSPLARRDCNTKFLTSDAKSYRLFFPPVCGVHFCHLCVSVCMCAQNLACIQKPERVREPIKKKEGMSLYYPTPLMTVSNGNVSRQWLRYRPHP